ncbi:MAG: acyl-CoA dehydrogenase family protein [Microthrixaceae bacterium]
MDLLPNDEQAEIVASVAAMIAARQTLGEPLADSLWESGADQGWLGLSIPEECGGVGYGPIEATLLFMELGRAVVPGPFLATALAAHVAATAGRVDLAGSLVGGRARVALAQPYEEGHSLLDRPDATYALRFVDGTVAIVDLDGLPDRPIDSIDVLVPISATTALDDAAIIASVHGSDADAVARLATLWTAAMLAGIAAATTDQSVQYSIDREQFGQPIGGFQAVKHRCADMATRSEAASCQVAYAAVATDNRRDDADAHVRAARAVAADAAITNARVNVQNHGGIGFTWEHSAHRYVTRSLIMSRLVDTVESNLAATLAAPAPR